MDMSRLEEPIRSQPSNGLARPGGVAVGIVAHSYRIAGRLCPTSRLSRSG